MSEPNYVNTEAGCASLVRYLYSPTRKLPVVVVTQRRDNTGPCIKGPQFAEALGPMAKVYLLSGGVRRIYNELLDNFYGIEPSGVRLYVPGMKKNDYPSRHKVWNELRIDTEFESDEAFIDAIREICVSRLQRQLAIQEQHAPKVLTFAQAEKLLFKQPIKVETQHPRSGRKVLTLPKPKVTEAQVMALADKFKARA